MLSHESALTRRAMLRGSALCLAGLGSGRVALAQAETGPPLFRIGLVTDLHYADKPPTKTRFYRDALAKLDEAVDVFNRERPAFVVELGDFIDEAPTVEQELEWLKTLQTSFSKLAMPRHYVLGNHCVTTLTKAEFAAATGSSPNGYAAFDHQGHRFIIIDACYRSDGTPYGRKNFHWQDTHVPAAELEWLARQVSAATTPVIVFAHQRLDVTNGHSVRNAAEVRAVLEKSGKVSAVFQGHSHQNDYQQIGGIHYTTLVAMVEGPGLENSGYCLLDIMNDGSMKLDGFRRQESRQFKQPQA